MKTTDDFDPQMLKSPPGPPVALAPFKNFMAFAWSDYTPVHIGHDYLGRFETQVGAVDAIAMSRAHSGAIYNIADDVWTEVSRS